MNENCLTGMHCPSCHQEEGFHIGYTLDAVIFTTDDGTDDIHGDLEYGPHSVASCPDCGWQGTVNDLHLAHNDRHGTGYGIPRMTPREAIEANSRAVEDGASLYDHAAADALQVLRDSWIDATHPEAGDPDFTVAAMVRDIDRTIENLRYYRDMIA